MRRPQFNCILLALCLSSLIAPHSSAQSSVSPPVKARQQASASIQQPFDRLELLAFLSAPWDSLYDMDQVRIRGLGFVVDQNFLEALTSLHASPYTIDTLKHIPLRSRSKESADRDHAYQLLLSATRDLAAKDYASATGKYEQALLLAPDSATLHLAYAGDLLRLQRYSDAEVQARGSLELWPDDADAHSTLATALIADIHEAEAVSEAKEALRIDPEHKAALIMLSMALTRNSQCKEAVPILRQAILRTPELPTIHRDLGVCLVHTGDLDGAVQELTSYISKNPGDADAHYFLGVALRAQGAHDDAILQFREASRLAPENPLAAAAANDDILPTD